MGGSRRKLVGFFAGALACLALALAAAAVLLAWFRRFEDGRADA